jgi:membrane protein implicated in regulation of membrane protease activity
MLITAYLFKLARKLVSKGSVFSVDQVVGKRGTVYQRISADGRGKINVELNDSTREIEAIAEDKQDIDSFQTVEVVRVVDQRTVAVKKI